MQYTHTIQTYVYTIIDMKITLKFLLLLVLGSCVGTKPTMNENGLIELSQNGDYIRPIKTSVGYYYNNPKGGKVVHIKNTKH